MNTKGVEDGMGFVGKAKFVNVGGYQPAPVESATTCGACNTDDGTSEAPYCVLPVGHDIGPDRRPHATTLEDVRTSTVGIFWWHDEPLAPEDKPTFAYSLAMFLTRNGQQGNAPEMQADIEQFMRDKR